MHGMIHSRNKRTFEDFKNQIPREIKSLFFQIRELCLSFGENVVEDERMHRIVFGKSMNFRWFADLESTSEEIIVKIQKNRKEFPITFKIQKEEKFEDLKNLINEAFTSIH